MARGTTSRAPRRRLVTRRSTYLSRSVVCKLGGITEPQLALWESEEFVAPARMIAVQGRSEPVYDGSILRRIHTVRALGEELGINQPGIGVILHLLDRLSGQDS
jgi:DNA-binding transcriptional MerR regulator